MPIQIAFAASAWAKIKRKVFWEMEAFWKVDSVNNWSSNFFVDILIKLRTEFPHEQRTIFKELFPCMKEEVYFRQTITKYMQPNCYSSLQPPKLSPPHAHPYSLRSTFAASKSDAICNDPEISISIHPACIVNSWKTVLKRAVLQKKSCFQWIIDGRQLQAQTQLAWALPHEADIHSHPKASSLK